MGAKNSIKSLPEPIQEECNQLIRRGRTIDEIVAKLRELGAEVSRSAVGRYTQGAKKAMERYAQAQAVAKVWVEKLEHEPSGDVARLLPQMLSAVAFNTIDTMSESDAAVDPKELMFLSSALKNISGARRSEIDTEQLLKKIRAEIKHATERTADKLSSAGVSPDTIKIFREEFMGIV